MPCCSLHSTVHTVTDTDWQPLCICVACVASMPWDFNAGSLNLHTYLHVEDAMGQSAVSRHLHITSRYLPRQVLNRIFLLHNIHQGRRKKEKTTELLIESKTDIQGRGPRTSCRWERGNTKPPLLRFPRIRIQGSFFAPTLPHISSPIHLSSPLNARNIRTPYNTACPLTPIPILSHPLGFF